MAFCQKCGSQVAENASFCQVCGAPVAEQPAAPEQQPAAQYQAPQYQQYTMPIQYVDPSDHTADFDSEDISANKVVAMSAYMLSVVGILIALGGLIGFMMNKKHKDSLRLEEEENEEEAEAE